MAQKKSTKKVAKKATKKLAVKSVKSTKKAPAKKTKKKAVAVDKNVRKVQRQANGSTTVVLPAELLRELKWKPKMSVVKKRGEGILIEKVTKK